MDFKRYEGKGYVDPTLNSWPRGGKKHCKLNRAEVGLLLKALHGRLTVPEQKELHALKDWLEQFK